MNNWRLLLLAVVVVVQPIGSFTESNLIDGRECCQRTEDARFYETGRHSLDGNREDRRSTDERSLKLFDESRGWRYERSMLSRSERTDSNPKDQAFRQATSSKIREDQNRNRDESRSPVGQVERDSRQSRSRDTLEQTLSVRLSKNARNTRSSRQSRDSLSRLPIRNSRDLKERQASGQDTAAYDREREVFARSDTRRDTRLTRSNSRTQLVDNRDRRAFDRNTQTDRENQRFANARDREIRVRMSNGINDREVWAVKPELRRQRDIEFRAKIMNNRDTERFQDSRDDTKRLTRNRIDTRNNERFERQARDENRVFKDALRKTDERRLSSQPSQGLGGTNTRKVERVERRLESRDKLRDARDARLARNSERNMRDERSLISRDETSDIRRQQKENRLVSFSTDRTEQRQQRDNIQQTRERSAELIRDRRETGRAEDSKRVTRVSSEERRLQRDRVLSSRNQQNREKEISDLRRKVLERGMERRVRMNGQDNREIRALGSVEVVRDSTRTTNNREGQQARNERQQTRMHERTIEQRMTRDAVSTQRHVTRLSRTENTRLERATRNDIRQTDERDMTKRVAVRATRNVESPQRLASGSRTANIRLVRSRTEVAENERREVRRDDIGFDRSRSSQSVQAERRLDNVNARNQMSRNRKVRVDERLDTHRERDVSSRESETVLAERRQVDEARRDREKIARNLNGVRFARIISERQQESRERHTRDVRGEARTLEDETREGNNRIARDSRNLRNERNLEARPMLTQDGRVFRDEIRGQRGDIRGSVITLQRISRVTERLNEKESRSDTQNERMTRNVERQGQRNSENGRESRIDMRLNALRIETSRIPLRDERNLKHQGSFRNVDVATDFMDTEESVGNWKLALYTLQGIYLCGLLVQMLTENGSKTKKRTFNWWSSHKDLVKVE